MDWAEVLAEYGEDTAFGDGPVGQPERCKRSRVNSAPSVQNGLLRQESASRKDQHDSAHSSVYAPYDFWGLIRLPLSLGLLSEWPTTHLKTHGDDNIAFTG